MLFGGAERKRAFRSREYKTFNSPIARNAYPSADALSQSCSAARSRGAEQRSESETKRRGGEEEEVTPEPGERGEIVLRSV